MKYDPKFATSPIFVTNKDYEFSVDPELITLVESDPFHGYESETVVATLFTHEEKFAITILLSCFLSHSRVMLRYGLILLLLVVCVVPRI